MIESRNPVTNRLDAEMGESVKSQTFGEWQPIETAPKDGTHIIVCWPNAWHGLTGATVVYWNEDCEWWEITEAGDFAASGRLLYAPTHWMRISFPY